MITKNHAYKIESKVVWNESSITRARNAGYVIETPIVTENALGQTVNALYMTRTLRPLTGQHFWERGEMFEIENTHDQYLFRPHDIYLTQADDILHTDDVLSVVQWVQPETHPRLLANRIELYAYAMGFELVSNENGVMQWRTVEMYSYGRRYQFTLTLTRVHGVDMLTIKSYSPPQTYESDGGYRKSTVPAESKDIATITGADGVDIQDLVCTLIRTQDNAPTWDDFVWAGENQQWAIIDAWYRLLPSRHGKTSDIISFGSHHMASPITIQWVKPTDEPFNTEYGFRVEYDGDVVWFYDDDAESLYEKLVTKQRGV
jgi:hypothetical protein